MSEKLIDLGRSCVLKEGIVAGEILIAEGGEVLWFSGEPLDREKIKDLPEVSEKKEISAFRGLRVKDEEVARKLTEVLRGDLIKSSEFFFILLEKRGKVKEVTYDPDDPVLPLAAKVVREDEPQGDEDL